MSVSIEKWNFFEVVLNAVVGGTYRIDIIDTWSMSLDQFADAASGNIEVELPHKNYLAIRVVRNC